MPSVCAWQAQGGGPVDWTNVESGLLSLRRTGLDMVSSPGWQSILSAQKSLARRHGSKVGSGLQPSREMPETNLGVNPSTHDACNAYYGPKTSRLVMQEQQAIYRAFGYVRLAASSHPPFPTPPHPLLLPLPHHLPHPLHAQPDPSSAPSRPSFWPTTQPHLVSCAGSVLRQGRRIHEYAVI